MDETSSQVLVVINDGPYGNEKAYNALRLAMNLVKRPHVAVQVFLLGDGVGCAHGGQKTPDGYYNVERMVRLLARRGKVAACRTCLKARGLSLESLTEGVQEGTMDLLGDWTLAAEQVVVF